MSDTKHGWVTPRADGARARCGGPDVCTTCQTEAIHEKMLSGLFGAPAATAVYPWATIPADPASAQEEAQPVAWMNPDTQDVISAERKASWLADFGAGGRTKAAGYTRALGDLRPAPAAGDVPVDRDAAFEAVRKRLCALPRYSFWIGDHGGVKRIEDRSGNWIDFDAAHELFDPVAVDAAIAAQRKGDA